MKDFPCTQCGLCCKKIGYLLDNKSKLSEHAQFLISKFPYKTLNDGSCEMLTSDNKCSVYDDRPLICNVKLMSKLFHIPYEDTAQICNTWIEENGLDESFKVKL